MSKNIKFKFVGFPGQNRKSSLPQTAYLKNVFTYDQIKPGTFSVSVMKRLSGKCKE